MEGGHKEYNRPQDAQPSGLADGPVHQAAAQEGCPGGPARCFLPCTIIIIIIITTHFCMRRCELLIA